MFLTGRISKTRLAVFTGTMLLLGLSLCISAFGQAKKKAALPFATGEQLSYQAEFTRGLLRGVNVGELQFSAGFEDNSSNQTWHLIGDASSRGLLIKILGSQFHIHVESTVDADPFTVLHTNKLDEERKRVRVSEGVFDHETRKVTWTERDRNTSQSANVAALDFSEPVQDVLTVIYFLRTQILQTGKSFDVPFVDAGRVYRCSVAVMERKQIKTTLGKVNAFRVEPAIFSDGGAVVRARGTFSIWITDDARRIPVKAQIKAPIGTFDIKLKRVRYPAPAVARQR